MCVCVRACVRACVRVRARARACLCVCLCVRARRVGEGGTGGGGLGVDWFGRPEEKGCDVITSISLKRRRSALQSSAAFTRSCGSWSPMKMSLLRDGSCPASCSNRWALAASSHTTVDNSATRGGWGERGGQGEGTIIITLMRPNPVKDKIQTQQKVKKERYLFSEFRSCVKVEVAVLGFPS